MQRVIAPVVFLIGVCCVLLIYDYAILCFIKYVLRYGWITSWPPFPNSRKLAEASAIFLLGGAPTLVVMGSGFFMSRYQKMGMLLTIALTLIALVFFAIPNAFFLGCHPIWISPGACS